MKKIIVVVLCVTFLASIVFVEGHVDAQTNIAQKEQHCCVCKCTDEFHVGDVVYDVVKGRGIVICINKENTYPVVVNFRRSNAMYHYKKDGRFGSGDLIPSLYKYKVKIVPENGNQ